MKCKSKLLLLPASILLLTGCGASANTSIPRGYTPIDKADPAARQAFFDKVGDDIALTYAKGVQGFLAEGSFNLKEFSLTQTRADNKVNSIKLANLKADYSFGLVGLNEGASKAKAMIKVENLGFKLNYVVQGKEYALNASDLDAAAYFVDNTLYYDLSDKDVKNFVNDAIDFSYAINEKSDKTERIAEDKKEAEKYLGKYFLKDNDEVEDVADSIPSALTSSEIVTIKSAVKSAFEAVLAEDKVKDLLTLSEDKNSKGAAIALALTSEPVEVDSGKVSGDLKASLVFDKEGLFSRFGFEGNADVSVKYDNPEKIVCKINKLDFGANFKYGSNVVKMPSFKDYVAFPNN